MGNVFFDTCVYHQPGINLLFDVIDPGSILFGSEMAGGPRHRPADRSPFRRHPPVRRRAEAGTEAAAKVYEDNARRVYPRLGA